MILSSPLTTTFLRRDYYHLIVFNRLNLEYREPKVFPRSYKCAAARVNGFYTRRRPTKVLRWSPLLCIFILNRGTCKHKRGKRHWWQVSGKGEKQAKEKNKWRIKQCWQRATRSRDAFHFSLKYECIPLHNKVIFFKSYLTISVI